MTITSSYWDEKNRTCLKHGHPQIPCPQCLAEKDKEIIVFLTEEDRNFLEHKAYENELEGKPLPSLKDLFPNKYAWLAERVV